MKKLAAALLAAALLVLPAQAVSGAPTVDAAAAVLMEKETGAILYEQNAHDKLEPASVTKVMTLLLVMEAIDSGALRYEDTVIASPHACSMGGQPDLAEGGGAAYGGRNAQGRVRGVRQRLRRGAGGAHRRQ